MRLHERLISAMLSLLAFALILAGCAASLPLSPPAMEARIPSPPVKLEPRHSERAQPEVENFSLKLKSYFEELQKLMTNSQKK